MAGGRLSKGGFFFPNENPLDTSLNGATKEERTDHKVLYRARV